MPGENGNDLRSLSGVLEDREQRPDGQDVQSTFGCRADGPLKSVSFESVTETVIPADARHESHASAVPYPVPADGQRIWRAKSRVCLQRPSRERPLYNLALRP